MRRPRATGTPLTTTDLADRLLEAQVANVVAQFSGPDAPAMLAAEVRDALEAIDAVPLDELVDREQVKATAALLLDAVGGSDAVVAMVDELVPLLRDLPAHDEHTLGEVVTWGGVEAVVDVLTRSQELREEVMRRLGQSPAASALAMRFVSALLGDAVQQNRERAEKVPGMKSVLGMGDLAARTARGMAPKGLEKVVGGAADRGTQAAMERVSRAIVDAFDEAMVREAVMELWDAHAEDEVAALRAYLADEDADEVAASLHALWLDLRVSPWFLAVVDAAIDAFLDRYGDESVGVVLTELGLDHDTVVAVVERHAGPVLDALVRTGHVHDAVRRRLEPFYRSEEALRLLSEAPAAG